MYAAFVEKTHANGHTESIIINIDRIKEFLVEYCTVICTPDDKDPTDMERSLRQGNVKHLLNITADLSYFCGNEYKISIIMVCDIRNILSLDPKKFKNHELKKHIADYFD